MTVAFKYYANATFLDFGLCAFLYHYVCVHHTHVVFVAVVLVVIENLLQEMLEKLHLRKFAPACRIVFFPERVKNIPKEVFKK